VRAFAQQTSNAGSLQPDVGDCQGPGDGGVDGAVLNARL